MALDTLRVNKLRSALTVLGIVIGITSIVGMTSLIRGFDESLQNTIRTLGPKTIFRRQVQRPEPVVGRVVHGHDATRRTSRSRMPKPFAGWRPRRHRRHLAGMAVRPRWSACSIRASGRCPSRSWARPIATSKSTPARSSPAGRSPKARCSDEKRGGLGYGPYQALFERRGLDPVGKKVRIGAVEYRCSASSTSGLRWRGSAWTTTRSCRIRRIESSSEPRYGAAGRLVEWWRFGHDRRRAARVGHRDEALREVEQIMRIRHGLTLDKPNDFDIVTQDAVLKLWEQISQAVLLSLVVISSIALMVGGIGVMAIMTISVTERTREIGVRKAIGARKREILTQFLIEAVVLTSWEG